MRCGVLYPLWLAETSGEGCAEMACLRAAVVELGYVEGRKLAWRSSR